MSVTYHVQFESDDAARAEYARLQSNIEIEGIGFSFGMDRAVATLAITVADGTDISTITEFPATAVVTTEPAATAQPAQEETPAAPAEAPVSHTDTFGGEFEM